MSLTFVMPVSQAGIERLKSNLPAIEFLGGFQKHTVIFCAAPSVRAQVTEIASVVRGICPNTFVESLPRDPEQIGKFGAFNMIFRESVEILYKKGNKNPWVWWEEDTLGIVAGYQDRLELEYHQKGFPFLGVRRKASDVMTDLEGNPLPENHPDTKGDYMVAVGVYPPNFKDYSTLYKYPDPAGRMPTDVLIRHEINKSLHHTNVIAHHYSTGEYERKGGKIVCKDFNPDPQRPSYAGEVSELAFIVHGVKDDSLAKLVLGGTPAIQLPTTSFTSSGESETFKLLAENAALREELVKLTAKMSEKENSYAQEIEELKENLSKSVLNTNDLSKPMQEAVGAEAPDIPSEKPLPPIEKVKEALAEAKKSVPLLDLVADFGCNKAELRKLIESDPSIKIAPGGRAWVSLAA